MPQRRSFLLLAAMAAASLAGCVSTPIDPASVVALDVNEAAGLAQVNAFRAENGLNPLRIDARLRKVAQAQSDAMAARDRMGHDVAGALPGRVDRMGYDWGTTAENIGRNYPDYAAAVRGWIGSPGHRRNLLNPNVTDIGFAGAMKRGGGPHYFAQVFASPSRNASVASAAPKPFRFGPEPRFR